MNKLVHCVTITLIVNVLEGLHLGYTPDTFTWDIVKVPDVLGTFTTSQVNDTFTWDIHLTHSPGT